MSAAQNQFLVRISSIVELISGGGGMEDPRTKLNLKITHVYLKGRDDIPLLRGGGGKK